MGAGEEGQSLTARSSMGKMDIYVLDQDEAEQDLIPVANSARSCTDLLWLAIFFAYLGGMVVLSIVGIQNGDPQRLVFGSDHQGNLCGVDDFADKKFIAYPRANEDILLSGYLEDESGLEDILFFGVCVAECPMAGDYVCTTSGDQLVSKAIADSGNTKSREQILQGCVTEYYGTLPFGANCADDKIRSQCWETVIDSTSVFFRCLPEYFYESEVLPESGCTRFKNVTTFSGEVKSVCVVYKEVTKVTREQPTASNVLFDTFNTYTVVVQAYFGDLVKAWKPILLSGLGVSSGTGLLFIVSLWCCVGVVVWATVFLTVLSSIAFTLFCYIKAGIIAETFLSDTYSFLASLVSDVSKAAAEASKDLLQPGNGNFSIALPPVNVTTLPAAFTSSLEYGTEFTYAAYASTGLSVILVILIFVLFEKISRAVDIFREASKAIRKNMFLVVVPFISMVFFFSVIGVWAYCTAFVASAGEFKLEQLNKTVSLSADETILEVKAFGAWSYSNLFVAYMFFGLLWILNFLNGITVMTISGAVLQWFWADEVAKGSTGHSLFPILRSFHTTLRYHLGTVAFGSLVLAFIAFIRYMAAAAERRMASLEKKSRAFKIIFCGLQCLLACVERFLKFVTRNAFIMSAMYGKPFCTSTKRAFVTVASNIAQVALVTFLGDVVQRFGQLFAVFTTGLACWVYLDQFPEYGFGGELQLQSFVFPVLVSMFIAWFVVAEVLSVYDITVDTILLSYCQDRRLKKYKDDHQSRSPPSVSDFMDRNALKDENLIRQASFTTIH